MADTLDLKSGTRKGVWVQLPPSVLVERTKIMTKTFSRKVVIRYKDGRPNVKKTSRKAYLALETEFPGCVICNVFSEKAYGVEGLQQILSNGHIVHVLHKNKVVANIYKSVARKPRSL